MQISFWQRVLCRSRDSRSSSTYLLIVAALTVACSSMTACGRRWTIDTGKIAGADRVDVILHNEPIATISDPQRVRDIVEFFGRYREGWSEPIGGPLGPSLNFFFYQKGQYLGDFGIGLDYITTGASSRPAPASEINNLASRLGLKWPPAR